MDVRYVRDLIILFVGDVVVFTGSLWLALVARHFVAPDSGQFLAHLVPFTALFAVWLVVFVIVGLYDRSVALFENKLPSAILEAQAVNLVLAVLFFFLAPVAIQPKTTLALYFIISTALIVIWRLGVFRLRTVGRASNTLLVGYGPDCDALREALHTSPHTRLTLVAVVDPRGQSALESLIDTRIRETHARVLVIDPRVNALLPVGAFPGVYRVDAADLFESLFARTPLSLVDREAYRAYGLSTHVLFAGVKRVVDVCIAALAGVLSLVVYPFVWAAVYFEDGGPLFVSQERVGKGGVHFRMYKFRSMTGNDDGKYGLEGKTKLRVTRVGAFLRKSRIDELPQLWSVLRGDQSLVGPRPELPALVERYREAIPLYDLRHLVTPGLSGWAQLYHQAHPHHGADVTETERKLSYDLYYIRHRSVFLELDIILKTVKALALRLGA